MEKSLTTLCYLEQDGAYLMLHRIKKEKDINKDKWIGVGGHAEDYESPEDCLLREVWEETGLRLTEYRFRGIVTFALLGEETQYMCLYTATGWEGQRKEDCREGVLEWVPKDRVKELELWTGDRIFFDLLEQEAPFFSLKLAYERDRLVEVALEGRPLEYLDIVDEQGRPTGKVKERCAVHRDGDLHRTSHLWIARQRGDRVELLLQKRSRQKDSHPGCYDISSAGHIPAGDSFEESALRELYEELGLRAGQEELIYCGTRRICYQDQFHGKPFRDNQVSKVYLLWKDPAPEEFRIQESEIESVCWMEAERLLKAVEAHSIPHCIAAQELDMVFSAIRRSAGPSVSKTEGHSL